MADDDALGFWRNAASAVPLRAEQPRSFRLMRYFTITTLAAYIAVAGVLIFLQHSEVSFFGQVQSEQRDFFAQAQATLARQHEEAARNSLLAVHEASHLNLTLLVGNLLWATDFGPFVQRVQAVPVEPCRAMPTADAGPRRACFSEVGARIQALPGFKALDLAAYTAMRGSTVFKIKVFDLRGIAVYSSEHAQIGEDGSGNQGWQSAAGGRPASELTHRDRFSAFERVVEARDLISTYVPVRADPQGAVVGVVELYSDVTPFLAQIKAAAQRFAAITASNDDAVDRKSQENQRKVRESSGNFLLIVGCLLAVLYGTSLLIVGNGQRLINKQRRAQAAAVRREQQRHREKMAALATMAANVSHEVGNPLAIIAGIAQELPDSIFAPPGDPPPGRRILEQTARVGAMMRRLSDFATTRAEVAECVDVNAMLEAVCNFHAFDRRFRGLPIRFEPGADLPACELVPEHLKETMMNLLQTWAEMPPSVTPGKGLLVRTELGDPGVLIRISHESADSDLSQGLKARMAVDPRLDAVRRRVADMRGQMLLVDASVQIRLPVATPEPGTSTL